LSLLLFTGVNNTGDKLLPVSIAPVFNYFWCYLH
jgi:hypothetical protein